MEFVNGIFFSFFVVLFDEKYINSIIILFIGL